MALPIKIPIPQSGMMYDPRTGRPSREWYIFWENIGNTLSPLSTLAPGEIFVGDAASVPTATAVSGDITLSSTGVALLQDTANVTAVVNAIISDSATNILANRVFGY